MVQVNHSEKIINAKVVYYGPPLGGKTTSLQTIHRLTDPKNTHPLISMNTAQDRTLFFDLLPFTVANVLGHTLKLKLYTVPGQVQYSATRRVVLAGADAVVMVADSQKRMAKENRKSIEDLKENLKANGLNYKSIPLVIQYNKRDLNPIATPEELEQMLNDRGVAHYLTVATTGVGVMESFVEIIKALLLSFRERFGSMRKSFNSERIAEDIESQFSRYFVDPDTVAESGPEHGGTNREGGLQVSLTGLKPLPRLGETGGMSDQAASISLTGDIYGIENVEKSERVITRAENRKRGLKLEEQLKESVRSNIELSEQYQEMVETQNLLTQRVNELVTLSDIGGIINTSLDLDDKLKEMLSQAVTSCGGSQGSLLMFDSSSKNLEEHSLHGLERDPLNAIFIPGIGSVAHQLAMRREPLVFSNVRQDLFFGEVQESCRDIVSMMTAPLISGKDQRGMISIYSTDPKVVFDTQQLRFLTVLTHQAAAGIENAYLYEELKSERASLARKVEERTRELSDALNMLREADAAKDRFLSSVSHEMKTPLTSIVSYTELLLSFTDEPAETRQEFLDIIKGEAEKLHRMTTRVLYFTELESEHQQPRQEKIELDRMVVEVATELKGRLRAKDQKLSIRLRKPVLPVMGDPQRLFTVFTNLLENASKFSPNGTGITLSAETLRSGNHDLRYPVVRIVLRDQGPGIAPADHERLFQRFEQGGELLTSKPDGMGMGLPIARKIVEDHGGRIEINSEVQDGTEFIILLEAVD
jgi:signal transduction histidine kinase/signal recognition particle receptor subunit beta